MPTSYTSLLGLALPVTGELSGTWGDTVNDLITKYVDAAVAGAQTISGSQTAVTLSTTNGSTLSQAGAGATGSAQYAIINCTGNPGGLLTITAPAASKAYLVINATSTNQSVKVVGSGPTTGVTIAASRAALIAWNGSDFRLIATTDASQLSGILAVANGGTGLSSGTSGGVPYFSATTTMASSAALAANAIVLGGGAGAAPATTTTGTGVVTAIGNAVNTSGGLVTQSGTLAASSLLLGGGASTAISSTTTGTGVVTALGVNTGTAGAFVVNGGALGTPSSGTLTNATGLPISTGVSGLGTGVATALAVNTGTAGAFVVNGGALGTPSSGTVTNLTGTASININGTVGATTPSTGAFTTLTSNDAVTFSATTQNIALGTSQTSGTWTAGGASQTGTITLDQSTKAHTLNIGTGATENATTKTINIGTAGVSGSTTAITIGSSVSGATSNITLNTSGNVTFQSVDAGATAGPILNLYRNSASPAASDVIGQVLFQGKDSVGNDQTYAYIQSGIEDATSTSEDGNIQFFTTTSGSASEKMRLSATGNLGIGVTPSAWNTVRVVELGELGGAVAAGGNNTILTYNTYYDSAFKYAITGRAASYYQQTEGAHIWYYAAAGTAGNTISFTERMRINNAGDVGIGTSSPSFALDIATSNANIRVAPSITTNNALTRYINAGGTGFVGLDNSAAGISTAYALNVWHTGAYPVVFGANNTERARITSGGDFLVGSTNASASAGLGAKVIANANGAYFASVTDSTTNGAHTTYNYYSTGAGNYRFYVGAAGTVFAVSTTISGISDQRLKENIQDIDVGLDKIMALKPRKFDWKPGKGKDKKGDRGWIAQEFEQVFPEMIDTWKDPAPEGEEPYKAVNADLIPVLVKAIQELKTELDSVKAELAALKGA